MKKYLIGAVMAMLCAFTTIHAAGNQNIGVVDFRTCVENSKLGKQERANFEAMKKQMEKILSEKEKELNEMAGKLSDADYLDSITPEAEKGLKEKFRSLSQEMSQQQNQYLQTLQQANMKVIQKIGESITNASEAIAKEMSIDLVLNDDVLFYHSTALDITEAVVKKMNEMMKSEIKTMKSEFKTGLGN